MGRYVFGSGALMLGLAGLLLHAQLISNWQLPGSEGFIVVSSVAQIAGGAAMFFRKTNMLGAMVLGIVYLAISLTFLPGIVAQPGVYASWGNVSINWLSSWERSLRMGWLRDPCPMPRRCAVAPRCCLAYATSRLRSSK